MWVRVCMGFVTCGCVGFCDVWVSVMCGCFGNMCTSIYRVFVFCFAYYLYSYLLLVRTTAIE